MSWDKSGTRISGTYYGIKYQGIIESTRVKYGGGIQYRVILDTPIMVYGDEREALLISKEEFDYILGEE
jgi:hypothetical protein